MNWTSLRAAIAAKPTDTPLRLRNLRAPDVALPPEVRKPVADGLSAVDLTVQNGKIAALRPADPDAEDGIDMVQRMVWPTTVDCHTHIDKGQVWARSPNPDGTFAGALEGAGNDFGSHQTQQDVAARATFMLQSAYAHGTSLLRSHVDADPATIDARMGVLSELAQDWAGWVEVQLCPFTGQMNEPGWIERLAGFCKGTHTPGLSFFLQSRPDLDTRLNQIFRAALDQDVALDFHADETLEPTSNCLEAIARAALRFHYDKPILVGHCCSLSVQSETQMARILDLVAQTQIGIVALPLCNLYLQDRHPGRAPRQRGIAPLKEICARGIPVAIASDNARDAFYAYGDLNAPDLFRDAMRMMQLDHPVGDWPATVTSGAAALIDRPDQGRLFENAPADLILFPARNWSEFAARPATDRIVIRQGRTIDTNPPDFADLDTLKGMTP